MSRITDRYEEVAKELAMYKMIAHRNQERAEMFARRNTILEIELRRAKLAMSSGIVTEHDYNTDKGL